MMHFPLWRYGAYAFAIAATLCLAAANIAWAWSLEDGAYRYVMIGVSVAADVGAPCALMAMMWHHAAKDPASALAAFVVWACCGYAEVRGAEVWLKVNSFVLSAPVVKANEAQKAASAALASETANLADIRRLLASERREVKLDNLRQREKGALALIETLRPQTFAAGVEPARSQYAGNEQALAFALWLLSQVAWRMAVGRLHGAPRVVVHGEQPPVVLTVRPNVRPELVDVVPSEQAALEANNEAIEYSQEGRVRANGEQSDEQLVRPVLAVVPKDAFAERALAYSRAGFSIRQIARKMGCGATKVHSVLKPKTPNTLKGRA
jgi:hypothetical protein